MPTVEMDKIGFGEPRATKRHGAFVALTRYALVSGLVNTDPRALKEAIDAIETAGYTMGSSLNAAGMENLVLVSVSPKILKDSPTDAIATLEYAAAAEAEVDFLMSGTSSLTQVSSERDVAGNQITVSHTFPEDDPDFANLTLTQGVEINVMYPTTTLRGIRYLDTEFPHHISHRWVGYVNEAVWGGVPIGCALCTRADFHLHDKSGSTLQWKFTFEFMIDLLGHQPNVVFQDARTGRPPPGLVWLSGYRTVPWYLYQDFNTLFPLIAEEA